MRVLLVAFFLFLFSTLKAQKTVNIDEVDNVNASMFQVVSGQPYVNVKFVRLVDGSPYFSDNWMKGVVVLTSNNHHARGYLKLNLLDDELHFMNGNNQELIATTPVKEITLTDSITNIAYHFVHSSDFPELSLLKKGWYLVLASGKASLYQLLKKRMSEQRPYGATTTEQRVDTIDEYYILEENAVTEVKKVKDLSAALHHNKPEMEAYLKSGSKGATTSDKFTASVMYYNSLK